MTVALRILGLVSGPPTALDGKFLRSYEPLAWKWREVASVSELDAALAEWVTGTDYEAEALAFPDAAAAMECWQRAGVGIRPADGEPNRPLTAFHVEVVPLGLDPDACSCGTVETPELRARHGSELHSPYCPVGKVERSSS